MKASNTVKAIIVSVKRKDRSWIYLLVWLDEINVAGSDLEQIKSLKEKFKQKNFIMKKKENSDSFWESRDKENQDK